MSDATSQATAVRASLAAVPATRLAVMRAYIGLCILLVVVGEITLAAGAPMAGIATEALAIVLLAGSRWQFEPAGMAPPPRALSATCLAIALLPIMRLLSVTIPMKRVSEIVWYVLIGAPLLLVAHRLMVEQEHLRGVLRLHGKYVSQGIIALSGIPLGLLGYAIAEPRGLDTGSIFENPLVALVLLTIFSGLMEEMVFRGVLTDALESFFGPWAALLGANGLFAIFHLGTGHPWYAIFALYYGLMFSLIIRRSGSMLGVAVAHGILTTGVLIIWPAVF